MKKSQTSLRFRVIVFILTVGMIAFAFIHSSMPADLSGEESESVMGVLQYILDFLGFSAELTDHIVRKAAHFAEYTVIGMLLVSCAYSFSRTKPYRYYSQILFAGLATAVIDETIQLNVPGRSGQITDVLLDFSGVITGAVIMLLIYLIYRKIRKIK
ncbi:MAG: VanZ family protein [Ruminococcus sp.]